MSKDQRVQAMLDELMDSHATPEQLCAACPELLPELRRKWSRLTRVRAELDLLFPATEVMGSSPSDRAPQHARLPKIPGYEVEAVLGLGGASIVYRALNLRLNRHVALKMLLAGPYATPEELERFQLEAQAVAGLHHPNIVQLYEAGDVDQRPYFTMELVEGGNLARKLAGAPQPVHEAASLLASAAEAVHFAHQRGIIHRDLKPANILLAVDGTPKVSDFGLARRLESAGMTITGVALGTPSYMSPEQARGQQKSVGPAADVYALGAILYETLTGRPPFRGESSAATLQQVLADDPVPPAQLNPRVPRDLETICLKCLDKDPNGRYASAEALADDLRRFGRGEPITARPVGLIGRSLRFARRRPAVAALSGALLAATILLVITLVVGVVVANNARKAALAAREEEAWQRARAVRNLERSEKANEILLGIFHGVSPRYDERGDPPLVAQLSEELDRAADLLVGESVGEPLDIARMQLELGHAQLNLGYPERAIEVFTKARRTVEAELGADHPDALRCLNSLALAYRKDGQISPAIALGEDGLTRRRRVLGADHADTLSGMSELASAYLANAQPARAIPLCEAALSALRQSLGSDGPECLPTMRTLALAYDAAGRSDRAAQLFQEVLALNEALYGPDHLEALEAMTSIGVAYLNNGEPLRALPLLEESLTKHQARFGPAHPRTLETMSCLAQAYVDAGQEARAVARYEQVRERYETQFGPDHRDTLQAARRLAGAYRSVGRLDDSLALYETVAEKCRSVLGPDDPDTLLTGYGLAQVYRRSGQVERAVQLYEDILERQKVRLGADHPATLRTLCGLGAAYVFNRQRDKAIATLEHALQQQSAVLSQDHVDLLVTMTDLAAAYHVSGQAARGIPLLEHVVEIRKSRLGASHAETLLAMANLSVNYCACERYAEAEPILVQWLAEQRKRLPPDALEIPLRQKRLGQCRLMLRNYAGAEESLRDALAIFEKRQASAENRHETESMLGAALAGQKKNDEAESLLVRSATALKAGAGNSSSASRKLATAAVQRVIDLYESCDRHDDAAPWRTELKDLESHE